MKVQLILEELFTFFTMEFYFFYFITLERIFGTLVKVNRLLILIESCSASYNLFEY